MLRHFHRQMASPPSVRAYRPRSILAGAICVLLWPSWTAAQDRVRVTIDGVSQATAADFEASARFTELREETRLTAEHRIEPGPSYGIGLTARAWKNLLVGIGVSFFSKKNSVSVSTAIPHPFFFNRPRPVSGIVPSLRRTEIGTHILLGWLIPATPRLEIAIAGGPSVLQGEQPLIDRVAYTHSYPYDEAQFAGVTTIRAKETGVGFNVGADVTWRFASHVGIGGTLRYSRATIDTRVGEEPASFDVGGLHAGGGIRLIF